MILYMLADILDYISIHFAPGFFRLDYKCLRDFTGTFMGNLDNRTISNIWMCQQVRF